MKRQGDQRQTFESGWGATMPGPEEVGDEGGASRLGGCRGGTAAGFMVGMEVVLPGCHNDGLAIDQGKQRSCQPRLAGGHVAIRQAEAMDGAPVHAQVLESLGLLSFADCGEVWKVRVRPLSVCDRDHRDGDTGRA